MRASVFRPPPRWGPVAKTVNVILLASLLCGGVTVPEAWAADLYVSSTAGNDANTCLAPTPAGACKTITHALNDVAMANDVIHVAPGTYDPTNVESFPLALKDGVAILGDVPENLWVTPGVRTIASPSNTNVFENTVANTPTGLATATRLAGFTLTHSSPPDNSGATPAIMYFYIGGTALAPRIDHNAFAGFWSPGDPWEGGIWIQDDSPADGSFTGTIENNTFTGYPEAFGIYLSSQGGTGDNYSPVVASNTFTGSAWPISYAMESYAEGTVAGSVTGNTFEGSFISDVYVRFNAHFTGGLTFSPTISGNTFSGLAAVPPSGSANLHNVFIEASFSYADGDISFAPTISNNTMTTASGSNIDVYSFEFYSVSGNVGFTPTITGNTMSARDYNVRLGGTSWVSTSFWGLDYNGIAGDVTISPTISGNSMGNGEEWNAVRLSFTGMSVDSGYQNIFSPTITGNQIAHVSDHGIYLFVTPLLDQGTLASTLTISGNTITSAATGVEIDVPPWSPGYAPTSAPGVRATAVGTISHASWTISNNTASASGANNDGIMVDIAGLSYSSSGAFDLTIAGNTITEGAGEPPRDLGNVGALSITTVDGIDVEIGYRKPVYPPLSVPRRGLDVSALQARAVDGRNLLIQGNTVTGMSGTGIDLSVGADRSFGFHQVRITDNVVTDGGGTGLFVQTPGYSYLNKPVKASCNLIENNAGSGVVQGTLGTSGDFGGGANLSPGNNVLSGNGVYDVEYTESSDDALWAANNYWGGGTPNVFGNVITDNPLTSAPATGLTVQLDDTLFNDVAPTGASIGDTICYEATISNAPGSVCGEAGIVFSVPIPPNASYVAGSLSTDPPELSGSVSGGFNSAVTVYVGTLPAPVTVQWCVEVLSGTELSSQGVASAGKSGDTPSDDPATTPPQDPTVTVLQQEELVNVPTLGEWGLIALAGLLLAAGAALLRRRRAVAAGLVLIVAAGTAWAGVESPRRLRQAASRQRTDIASTVVSTNVQGSMVTLTLADGTSLTIPRHDLRVRSHRQSSERARLEGLRPEDRLIERSKLRAARLAERARLEAAGQSMTPEQRIAKRQQRRLERGKAGVRGHEAGLERARTLAPGTPVVVGIERDAHGRVVKARIDTFASEQQARDVLQRRLALRTKETVR